MRGAVSSICRVLVAGAALSFGSGSASAISGNEALPACKLYLTITDRGGHNTPDEEGGVMDAGECRGVVYAMMAFSKPVFTDDVRFCPPRGVTAKQLVRVVVAYIDSKPGRAHEDFLELALEALRKAWPCR